MKGKHILIFTVIALIIVAILLLKGFGIIGSKFNYDNLRIYKNNSIILLANHEDEKIVNYLKKENFKKVESSCTLKNTYKISFDNVELSFDDNDCASYYKNNKTKENHYTNISSEFKNYIINLAN